jgi:AcrR family transcriptional regulator
MVHFSAMVAEGTKGGARERLLQAVLSHLQVRGVTDLSLRELAVALGTSHRMLIYHFGSGEGLMVAVVQAVEAEQRAFLEQLVEDRQQSPAAMILSMWRRLADPGLAGRERLFFELYGQALQGRRGTEGLLDRIVDAWVEVIVRQATTRGLPQAQARIDARLGVAVTRGLLLDLLATGDRAPVDEALERFASFYEQWAPLAIAHDTPAEPSVRDGLAGSLDASDAIR